MPTSELRKLRAKLNWSPDQAAKTYGYSLKVWNAMEDGNQPVNPALLASMAHRIKEGKNVILTPRHLKAFRATFTLTQALAAGLVGVTRVTFNRWENEREPIPTWLLPVLRDVIKQLKEGAK